MSVTKEFAVAVDTELADLYDQVWVINNEIETYRDYMKTTESSNYMSDADKRNYCVKYAEKIDELLIKRAPLKDRVRELQKVYMQDPWTRAFLVINSNGHVHSSMECTTCFDTTRYTWLVQYSNDDEATIVSDAGETACTVCYSSAPADVLNRPSVIVTADKIAKAEAKAERDAKREAKEAKARAAAPTKSGEALIIPARYSFKPNAVEMIKTERTAVSEFNNNFYYAQREIVTHYYNGEPHTAESIAQQKADRDLNNRICVIIARALADKHGVTFEEMWEKLVKKARKAVA